jgi:hypothetical protein
MTDMLVEKQRDIQSFYKQVRIMTSHYNAENYDYEWVGSPREFNEQFLGVMRGALVELNFRVTIITSMGSLSNEYSYARFNINEILLGCGTPLHSSTCDKISVFRTNQWWIDIYLEKGDTKVLITVPMSRSTEEMVKDIIA